MTETALEPERSRITLPQLVSWESLRNYEGLQRATEQRKHGLVVLLQNSESTLPKVVLASTNMLPRYLIKVLRGRTLNG